SHDYVAQSLLHLQQHPDLDHDAALAVLGDARTKLEQALAQGTVEFASDLTEMLDECVHGYRVFGLEARLDVRSEDDLAPAANTLGEASGQALLLALNQGLGNVLAHSSDRHPTVEVTINRGSAQLRLTNRTDTLAEKIRSRAWDGAATGWRRSRPPSPSWADVVSWSSAAR
ncbi:MAG: hypothetical protein KA755_13880, partial [Candidatus Microthrix sp.]|nr:hypothetical protein [Candidatus Microthrix sp.]